MEDIKYSIADLDAINEEFAKQTNMLEDSDREMRSFMALQEEFADKLGPEEYAIFEEQKSLMSKIKAAHEDLINAYKDSIKEIEESLEKQKEENSSDNK